MLVNFHLMPDVKAEASETGNTFWVRVEQGTEELVIFCKSRAQAQALVAAFRRS